MGEFGERLRKAREAMSYTQGELAEKMGLTQASISQFESGRRVPTPALIGKFADVLGVKRSVLAGQSEGEFEKELLFRNVEGLSPETLRTINDLVEKLKRPGSG